MVVYSMDRFLRLHPFLFIIAEFCFNLLTESGIVERFLDVIGKIAGLQKITCMLLLLLLHVKLKMSV